MSLEILIVLAISIGLMSVVVPQFVKYLRKAKTLSTVSEVRAVILAIENFRIFEGEYPKKLDELVKRGYISRIPENIEMEDTGSGISVKVKRKVDPGILKVYFPSSIVEDGFFKILLRERGT